MLAAWSLGEVAPEIALEELHAAFELLLTRASGKRRASAFSELVDLTIEAGWLGDQYTDPRAARAARAARAYWEDPTNALDERELLLSLKDQRKAAKHQGDAGAGGWLAVHFDAATALLERLSERMP